MSHYDRRATGLSDIQKSIENVKTLMQQQEWDRAFRTYAALKSRLVGYPARETKANFMYYAGRPKQFDAELDRLLKLWQQRQQSHQDASATVPAAKQLLQLLEQVSALQSSLAKDPGAQYFQPWLESVDTTDLVSVLKRFLADHA